MIIRIANNTDVSEIKSLFQETILSVNLEDYSLEQVECWAKRGDEYAIWEERINKQYFIVCEEDNFIVGFAALKPDGYLNSLFVHKNFQRQGVASLLLSHIEEYARQNQIREITVDVSITAKSFFEKKKYELLYQQVVSIGIEMINYKMRKILIY